MTRAQWTADASGRYWLDIELGGAAQQLMVDTGLVDPLGLVGFEVNRTIYDDLKRAKKLSRLKGRTRIDASGQVTPYEIGLTTARLIDPASGRRVGPVVDLYVMRNPSEVASRVGALFFHALAGCRVDWDLTARRWCVECP